MTGALAALNRRIDMVIIHSWTSFQQTFEARASEWFLGAITASLAIVTMLNDDLFQGLNFVGLKSVFSQDTWALIFLVLGVSRIIVLIINGNYWRTPHFRCAMAFFSCFLWFQLALGLAPNMSLGLAVFPWLFLLDAFNALRAGREVGMAQVIQHHRQEAKSHGESDH